MSGAVKAVTKVFKKVTKSTVGKFIVAAAVSYFTAGLGASVLGATSFGATLSPTMATVLSHAISGSIAGGITSAISGGGIGKGLLLGAAGGAVMGGVQSAMGNYTAIPGATATAPTAGAPTGAAGAAAPSASAGATTPGAVGAAPSTATPTVQNASLTSPSAASGGALNAGPGGTPVVYVGNGVNSATIPTGQSVMTPAGTVLGTGRTGLGGWVDSHPELMGKMISGAAKGAIELAAGGGQGGGTDYAAATEQRIAAEQADQLRIQGSHSGTGGLLTASSVPQQKGGLAPSQRWNTPDTAYNNGRWQYDQASGHVVFVPSAPTPSAA